MRTGSTLIVFVLLCGSGSLIAQEEETSTGDHVTQKDGRVGFRDGISINVDRGHPDMAPNGPGGIDHADRSVTGGNPGILVDRQNAINEVIEHINELKARRDAIAQEELDHLNDRDADFAAGLGPEWDKKMNELRVEMALVYNEISRGMGRLRDLTSPAGQGGGGGAAGSNQGGSPSSGSPNSGPSSNKVDHACGHC
jgi:hypothetical protein